MKLFLTATSERGKPITKSGNDWLKFEVVNENREIVFSKVIYPAKVVLKGYLEKRRELVEKCPSCGELPDYLGRCKCCNKDAY
jgi:hypothetical protein